MRIAKTFRATPSDIHQPGKRERRDGDFALECSSGPHSILAVIPRHLDREHGKLVHGEMKIERKGRREEDAAAAVLILQVIA